MSKNRFVAWALLGTLLATCSSLAQTKGTAGGPSTGNSSQLVSKLTLEEFQRRVQSLGFQCERGNTDGKPDDYFTFKAEGRKVGGKLASPELVELFVYYTDGASLATVNEWNNTHFASTAFVDKDGDAVLESELILTGGISEENLDTFITNFRDSATDYARFILDHAKEKAGKTEKPAP
jgi:Putative bacterial sensory transduction regulator